jgi:formylglycine-generating enzyme required for sulfatase activity
VDFTDKPYKESLADIKRLLSNTQKLSKPLPLEPTFEQGEPSPLVTGPLIPTELSASPEPSLPDEPDGKNRLQRFILPVGLAVLALAVVVGATVFALNRNTPPPPSSTATLTSTQRPPTVTVTSTVVTPPPQIIDGHRVTMRLVGAGDFTMGSETGTDDEQPVRILFLDAFYIDKYEVTNRQYKACVGAGACVPPKQTSSATRTDYYSNAEFNDYPVVNVDWNMARSYCEWRGARLPTEAEWEKAARGPEGSTYPGGDEVSCDEANYSGCEGDTALVSSFGNGLSFYGVHNMAGNVYEWASSLYMPYPYDLFDGREDLEAPGERVMRGGSWLDSDSDNEIRSAHREKADPSNFAENIGFRCARTPDDTLLDIGFIVDTPENGSTATAYVATNRSDRTREARPTATSLRTPSRTPTPGNDVTITAIAITRSPTVTRTPVPIAVTTVPPLPAPTTVTPDEPEPNPTTETPSYP